ncbi:tRNA pseudouridine(13) synthase TruD [Candidatus Woesearchaeota archaeon]|nr:tRNA pseudouridine(13) synthase TruD [Candidatus Woesearchaeota archaeon]
MKLRQLPEDFKVEEISNLEIKKEKSNFKIYLLEKKSAETFALLDHLAKTNKIPRREFCIAGLKDKHAITKQYVCVPATYDLRIVEGNNFKLTFLGYTDKKMHLGDLWGNKFQIIIRALRKGELDGVKQKASDLEQIGVPNYFDSQRFGSVVQGTFIAKALMQRKYEQAVKIYLTECSRHELQSIKQDKRLMVERWDKLTTLPIKSPRFRTIIDEYKKTKSWLAAYQKIPANLRELYVSAYQSYLWNECVKELLKRFVDRKKLYIIPYSIGSLLFYKKITLQELEKIPKTFKTISELGNYNEIEKEIISRVLQGEGISLQDFAIKEETGNFFVAHERSVIVKPSHFFCSDPLVDEINDRGKKNFFKFIVSFALPKGSYATIVTKRLFNK